MPTLHFKGKTFVQNHHLAVKYHQLIPKKELSLNDPAYGGTGLPENGNFAYTFINIDKFFENTIRKRTENDYF